MPRAQTGTAQIHAPWAPIAGAEDRRVPRATALVVALGAALFVLGVLAFVHLQTQHIFRETSQFEVSSGSIPRNDGGILFGAILAGLGPGLVLVALSPLELKKRIAPFLGYMGATAALLVAHFSIYANGIIFNAQSTLRLRASFLFSDANNAQPIAVFVLAGVTLVLLAVALFSAMRLVTPALLEHRFLRPKDITALRTRVVLLTLVFLGVAAGFLRQFLTYAITGDANPEAAGARMPLLVIYYLMTFSLVLLMGTVAVRVHSAVWGNLAERRSPSYRRAHAYFLNTETWLWAALLALNVALRFFEPIYQPTAQTDRVLTMNSRGIGMFFVVLTLGLYVLQRTASTSYLARLLHTPASAAQTGRDALWRLTILVIVLWGGLALITWSSDLSPLTQLILRTAAVALVAPLFVMRLDLEHLGMPRLRFRGGDQVLAFAALISILTGIMLWGIGNSVSTLYSRSGGFVTPEDATLQPYAVGIRLLGSIFIATPIILTLWLVASRYRELHNPGPLLLTGLSVIAGMNLLLTVDPTGRYDSAIRQTDVLIGFRIVGLGAFDQFFVTALWCAVAGVGFLAFSLLLWRARDRGAGRPQDARRPATSPPAV